MKNSVVIYKSIYGSTKKYATWIREELDCDIFEESQMKAKDLLKYDNIIYGGSLYASGISGVSIITKNFKHIKDKNIILFTVGLANPEKKCQFKSLLEKTLSKEMLNTINIFHLRGSIDYKKLSLKHKIMMWMLLTMMKKKDPIKLSDEDKLMIETYGGTIDFIDKNSINPIIKLLKQN